MKVKRICLTKQNICILLIAAVMFSLIMLLPSMAFAADGVTVEPGTMLIDFVDASTVGADYSGGTKLAQSILLRYDDYTATSGVATWGCPTVAGMLPKELLYYNENDNAWRLDGDYMASASSWDDVTERIKAYLTEDSAQHLKVLYRPSGSLTVNYKDINTGTPLMNPVVYVFENMDVPPSMPPHAEEREFLVPIFNIDDADFVEVQGTMDYVNITYDYPIDPTMNGEPWDYPGSDAIFVRINNGFQNYTIDVCYDAAVLPDPNVVKFNAALIVPSASAIPSATVNFSISGIQADIAAVPGVSRAILSPSSVNGVTGTPIIGSATFAPTDETVTASTDFTIASGNKADIQKVPINFSGVTFARPGIYRYIITEPSSGNNLLYDTQWSNSANSNPYQRVLDVYVLRDANDNYNIGGYVFRESQGSAGDGSAVSDKSAGFAHELSMLNLDISATVEGNQSALDKYFAFTVTITNPAGAEFTVNADWENGSTSPAPGFSSSYTAAEMAEGNTASWTSNENGVITHTFYLKHQQGVTISGIPAGSGYNISVAQEDYLPSWEIGSDSAETATTGDKILTENTSAHFVLENNGLVPTGVVLSIIPGVLIAAGALMVIVAVRQGKGLVKSVGDITNRSTSHR